MSPDAGQIAEVATVIVLMIASLATIGTATFFAIRRAMRIPRSRADDQRLEQLQQSVDAIAIEVERIAEAQRFSARLLAERTHDVPDSQVGARPGEPHRSVKG